MYIYFLIYNLIKHLPRDDESVTTNYVYDLSLNWFKLPFSAHVITTSCSWGLFKNKGRFLYPYPFSSNYRDLVFFNKAFWGEMFCDFIILSHDKNLYDRFLSQSIVNLSVVCTIVW